MNVPAGKVWHHPDPFMEDVGLRLPGTYLLVFSLGKETKLAIGRLGVLPFADGWYAYVGSAMGGLARRIRHHLRPHQRPRWHIDYLFPHRKPTPIIVGSAARPLECLMAGALAQRFPVVRRFGSSDCRCAGHLFHGGEPCRIVAVALKELRDLGCEPQEIFLPILELNDADASS